MKESENLGFLDILGQLDDPRIKRRLHPMSEILLLGAVISDSEGWNDIELLCTGH